MWIWIMKNKQSMKLATKYSKKEQFSNIKAIKRILKI